MVKALTLFVLTTMRVGRTTVDGLYLTVVKQTEHVTRRFESGLFGYMADLSDLFISGLPNPIYLYIRQANRTQPELT